MNRSGVLCAGSVVVDLGKVVEAYPALDAITTIESVSRSTGGPGLNLAVDLRLLGAAFPVEIHGAVGDDEDGRFVLAECARVGIDATGLTTVPGVATSFTDAMVERRGGRRTFFHHVGANAHFDVAAVPVERSTARILHIGAPGLHPRADAGGWAVLLERARLAGLHTNMELVSLAPERLREVAGPCVPHLSSIVVNEVEAAALTGVAVIPTGPDGPVDWAAVEKAASALIGLGVAELAVVHLPAGAVAAAPNGRTWRQGSVALPREEVRSTTGAGDAFAAGVILGLHEERPVGECLELGVAAAAACVRGPGTSDGIRPAPTCLAEAQRWGHRPT